MLKYFIIIVISFLSINTYSQKAYFADGYHGGIYGHYPMWQTQFMVDKLAQHPEWRISLEIEPETWDTVMVKDKVAYNNLKHIITDKRIDFTNPTYAQPYCYNISGESLIRQFQYGINKIHQHFPDVRFITYSAEEPCFTSSLPQILNSLGFKYAVLKNPDTCWGGYTRAYGGELVNWVGSDGTSMLTVPRYACEELEENSTWQTKAWANSQSYLDACFAYGIKNPAGMCFQDAGWKNGPWLGHGDKISNNSTYVTWTDYIENISVGKTADNWHFSQEDVLVSLMWGSQVLQRIAQEVRVSENRVVVAEKIAAMATLENGFDMPQGELDDAWRTLMMAQHHDSWIVPYNGLNKYRTWAEEITLWTNNTNAISDKIIAHAGDSYKLGNNSKRNVLGYIRVFNSVGSDRSETVSVSLSNEFSNKDIAVYNSAGKQMQSSLIQAGNSVHLIFNAEVPCLGYATFRLEEKTVKQATTKGISFDASGKYILENDMYKIVIDPAKGGVIKSLIAKQLGNKDFAADSNQYGLGELRGHFYDDNKFCSSADTPAIISILEDNELRTSVKIEGEIASHPYTRILTIVSGQDRIDFDLTINWKNDVGIGEYKQDDKWQLNRRAFYDDRFKLSILFPTSLSDTQLYKNAPFDVCESKLDNTFFNTWDSIKHNIVLNWIDIVQQDNKYGLALFSDHTTSYSFGEDFPLGLTAQYSGKGLWGPDYKITQPLKMKYAIVPHAGKWDKAGIWTKSDCWNEPLLASFYPDIALKDKSFVEMNNTGYEVAAMRTEGDDIIIRLFNAEGDSKPQWITFDFPVRSIEEIQLNGQLISKKKTSTSSGKSTVSLSIPRFGIRTLKIKKQS